MPRREQPLEPDTPVKAFAVQLRKIRRTANITYRAMADKTHFSHAHFVRAASGNELPSWEVTQAYLQACLVTDHGALKAWEQFWAATDAVAARPASTRRRKVDKLTTVSEFGKLLQEIAQKGQPRTLRELQDLTDIGKSTLNDWFQGRRLPSQALLHQFGVALGATSEEVHELQVARARVDGRASGSQLTRTLNAVLQAGQDGPLTEAAQRVSSALARAEERRVNRQFATSAHEQDHTVVVQQKHGLTVGQGSQQVNGFQSDLPGSERGSQLGGALVRNRDGQKPQASSAAQSRAQYEVERLRAADLATTLEPRDSAPKHQYAVDQKATVDGLTALVAAIFAGLVSGGTGTDVVPAVTADFAQTTIQKTIRMIKKRQESLAEDDPKYDLWVEQMQMLLSEQRQLEDPNDGK